MGQGSKRGDREVMKAEEGDMEGKNREERDKREEGGEGTGTFEFYVFQIKEGTQRIL
jgi:hypothetical protein